MELNQGLLAAYLTYLIGTASPGPANLAVMQTSLENGRAAGLRVALGVIAGSVFWGLVAAFGLSSAIAKVPSLVNILSVIGGGYLLWLGANGLRKVLFQKSQTQVQISGTGFSKSGIQYFFRGLGIHLTNPKAILVWLSIILLGGGTSTANTIFFPFLIVAGCALIGILVFCGYAFIFSNAVMINSYLKYRLLFNIFVSIFFSAVGIGLIYTNVA